MDFKKYLKNMVEEPAQQADTLEKLIEEGRLDEAEQLLLKRLETNPQNFGLRLRLGEIYGQTGRPTEAGVEFLSVIDTCIERDLWQRASEVVAKAKALAPDAPGLAEREQRLNQLTETLARRDLLVEHLSRQVVTGEMHEGSLTAAELQGLWPKLCDSRLLAALDDDQLCRLLSAVEVQKWTGASQLVKAGQELPKAFLVGEGTIEALAVVDGQFQRIRELQTGEFFGDRALFEGQPWPATYKTLGELTTTLALSKRGLEQALVGNSNPRALLDVLRQHGTDREIVANLSAA